MEFHDAMRTALKPGAELDKRIQNITPSLHIIDARKVRMQLSEELYSSDYKPCSRISESGQRNRYRRYSLSLSGTYPMTPLVAYHTHAEVFSGNVTILGGIMPSLIARKDIAERASLQQIFPCEGHRQASISICWESSFRTAL